MATLPFEGYVTPRFLGEGLRERGKRERGTREQSIHLITFPLDLSDTLYSRRHRRLQRKREREEGKKKLFHCTKRRERRERRLRNESK